MARRRTKKQIFGQALSGFGEGYMSAWVPMETMRLREKDLGIEEESLARQKKVDRLRDLEKAGERIEKKWLTPKDITPIVEGLALQYPDQKREEIEASLNQYLQPPRRRTSEALDYIGQSGGFADATRQQAIAAAERYGVPEEQYQELLPIPYSEKGLLNPFTGQFGPPESKEQWGGPYATAFETRQEQSLAAEKAKAIREKGYVLDFEEEQQRQKFRIVGEQLDEQIDRTEKISAAEFETLFAQDKRKFEDPEYVRIMNAWKAGEFKALTPEYIDRLKQKEQIDIDSATELTGRTFETQVRTRIDPESRETYQLSTWWDPEEERTRVTLLEDVPDDILSPEMKERLRESVEWSPFLAERQGSPLDQALADVISDMVTNGALNLETGEVDQDELNRQSMEVSEKSGGRISPEAARQRIQDQINSGPSLNTRTTETLSEKDEREALELEAQRLEEMDLTGKWKPPSFGVVSEEHIGPPPRERRGMVPRHAFSRNARQAQPEAVEQRIMELAERLYWLENSPMEAMSEFMEEVFTVPPTFKDGESDKSFFSRLDEFEKEKQAKTMQGAMRIQGEAKAIRDEIKRISDQYQLLPKAPLAPGWNFGQEPTHRMFDDSIVK
jgi:hypothetical protein